MGRLPTHRSKLMRAWLRCQRSWLVVEPMPGYAPDLNPVKPLWSNLKGVELANLRLSRGSWDLRWGLPRSV